MLTMSLALPIIIRNTQVMTSNDMASSLLCDQLEGGLAVSLADFVLPEHMPTVMDAVIKVSDSASARVRVRVRVRIRIRVRVSNRVRVIVRVRGGE